MSQVIEVRHPLVQSHLARLRDKLTPPVEFRMLVRRLTGLVAYEATQDLSLRDIPIETPLTTMTGQTLSQQIGLIPILRAGLGMVEPVLDLIPDAEVWHLGLYRDEATAQPVEYYSKLPTTKPVDVGVVLDPMLATGGSAIAALGALQTWGVPRLKLLSIISSRAGVDAVTTKLPHVQIYTCAIDPELDARKYIVPGLGDAGDRTFNTLRYLSE